MKQLLFLLLFIPAFLSAQEEKQYLAGAVPETDGKVIFSREINAPSLSQKQIYDRMLNWAEGSFNSDKNRIVYTNETEGDIAATGEDYLIFSSTALSLDRTLMSYKMTIECREQTCLLKITAIRYIYNVSYQRDPEKYQAEEWITDKYALNKNKTKLNRISGKFRKATINFTEELLQSASSALGVQSAPTAQVIPATPLTPAIPAATTPVKTTPKEGFVAFAADKIPNTILQMLPENKMAVTPGKDTNLTETNALWKGTGNMFGKAIASFSITPESPVYKTINDNDTYTVSFIKKEDNNSDSWMIIECRKQGETQDGTSKTIIGEILNVWIK